MSEIEFSFKEFCNLDKSSEADYLIQSMDVMLTLESVQKIKQESITLLNLRLGDSVLEVGCGFANDMQLISERVSNTGTVVAIDTSQRMLNMASERWNKPNIKYQLMNAEDIQYLDNHFDAVHADRLLVSHANYDEIFHEMLRVTKKGGQISLIDVDAKTIAITPNNEVGNIVLKQLLNSFVNPNMGRNLASLFYDHGLEDVRIKTNLVTIDSFSQLEKIFNFEKILQSCIKAGEILHNEAEGWLALMKDASRKKLFFYCITFFTVIGKKPLLTK